MKRLIAAAVQHPWSALVITALLMALGLYSAGRLPLDAVPDITNVQVQVNTRVEGLAPVQIEQQVTYPLETALAGVPGSVQVRSITRPRLSQITVVFRDGADIFRCRQLVAERLQTAAAELPEGALPEMGPISTGLGEVFFYTVEAREIAQGPGRLRQLMDLKDLQEWQVKPRLLTVPGVAEVNVTGGYSRQAVVQPRPERMAARGLLLEDLVTALRRANRWAGGGVIEQGAEQFSVSAVGALADLEAIRRVPVKADQSLAAVRVGDVATVAWGAAPRTGAGTHNGEEALVGTVLMLAGENSRAVARRVQACLDEIAESLPGWAGIKVLYNRSDLVGATLDTVAHNLAYGALLVVLVLVLLLGNPRAALITAATIPVAMLAAVTVMVPLGLSGNLMSLGAIDFGILVDGAVIVLDQCVLYVSDRRRRKGSPLSRHEVRAAVLDATLDVRSAAGFGQFIIIVAMLPLFGLSGVEGRTFVPMAATLALALGAAFVVSFSLMPALACLLLSADTRDSEPWLMRLAHRAYRPTLEWSLPRPGALLAGGGLLLGLALLLFTRLGAVFMPQLDEGDGLIQMIRPQTISLSESLRLQRLSEQVILEFGEVRDVFSRIGTPEIATDPMGVNLSDTAIMLKPSADWPVQAGGRRRSKAELMEAIAARLKAEVPGQRLLLTQPIQMRFNELLEGTRADVAVKVFGDDLETIGRVAAEAAEIIRRVPGAGDVELEVRGTTPILSIEPRMDVLGSLGLPSGEVLEAVETGIAGTETGLLYEGRRRYPLVVRLREDLRGDLDALRLLPVGIGPSATRPLGDLATLRFSDSYPAVSREAAQRRAAILVNPRGRDVEGFVLEARQRLKESLKLPEGYAVEWGGSFENLRLARARLGLLTPLALGLVLLMVYAAFGEIRLALLVFAGVPLALVGGVLALFARGLPFSISAGVGFIALAGIAVLNGVVLVSTSLRRRKEGMAAAAAVRSAAESRLRPVLMTALVDIFGFLPMMFSAGLGAEVQQPLATVVVGGVLSSTALTLLMLPSWQTWLERHRGRDGALSPPELKRHLRRGG